PKCGSLPRPLIGRDSLSSACGESRDGLREMMAGGEWRNPKSQLRKETIASFRIWDFGFGISCLTGELLDVDRLAAVPREERSRRLLVNLLQDVTDGAVGQEHMEAAADHAAQARQRLALRE